MIMKLRSFIFAAVAAVVSFSACEQKEDLGAPSISLSVDELTFDVDGGEQAITLEATRDWKAKDIPEWVAISPENGAASSKPQTVTVTVLKNEYYDRSVDIEFTTGQKRAYLTVSQSGLSGSADALVIYSNNFDVEKAVNNSGWPYLDSNYKLWDNKSGSGAETVEYSFGGKMSVRTSGKLSNDGTGYSHYAGSGSNKIFFGAAPSTLKITKITLDGKSTNYTLTYGAQKYLQDCDSKFSFDEFKVYVSNDSQKWVELNDSFPEGADVDGDWNLATANFTVPAGTSQLALAFVSSCSSAYSIDDVNLVVGTQAGQVIDFATGVELGGTTPGSGSTTDTPESKGKKTVAEFIAAADASNYYELTGTISGFNSTYCSFDLTDASGKIYVYSVLDSSKSEWKSKIANGGTITIYGKYLYYEQKSQHEVVDAYIVSYTAGEGGGNEGGDTPAAGQPTNLVKATVAEFLAAAESSDVWYELTGEIISIAKATYGNFTIKDATAEVYIYGMTSKWVGSNDQSFSQIGLKVGDTVTLGTLRGSYNGTPQGGGNPVPAFYISHVAGEGSGNEGGEDPVTPPAGDEGEYEPNITWTLGANAYDNTSSGNSKQTATVNGVSVKNLLKLGKSSAGGDATLHIPAGTSKIGFYCVAWTGKTTKVKFSVNGTEIKTISPAANSGATGNAPYNALNVAASDYYEVEVSATSATDVKVETVDGGTDPRALFVGLKAIAQ